MKRTIKILILPLLVVAMFLMTSSIAFATSHVENPESEPIGEESTQIYQIQEPYAYPIVAGSDQWNSFTTKEQRIAACHVDKEILENMATLPLVETVISYPLLVDMYAFNTLAMGIDKVSENFYGITELLNRPDAKDCLAQFMASKSTTRNASDNVEFECVCAESLLKYLDISPNIADGIELYAQSKVTLYTPKGTGFLAYKDSTWEDWRALGLNVSEAVARLAHSKVLETYPNNKIVRGISPTYNCHSYAWYSTETSNRYWIEDPSDYISDGSYTSTIIPAVGNKAFWRGDSHSAIVTSVSNEGVRVTSKWGMMGVYTHSIVDCPYSGTVTYWK